MKVKFEFVEVKKKDKFLIVKDNDSLIDVKKNYKNGDKILLDFDYLNLGEKLYGNNKKETKIIQKKNAKDVVKVYRKLCSLSRKIRRIGFDGIFYISNEKEKKNNNDLMLEGMINIHFSKNIFTKMSKSMLVACDFLDAENRINNM